MDALKKYKLKTYAYTIAASLGVAGVVVFGFLQRWVLLLLSIAFTYVALDNVFCGTHARKCGYDVDSHYVIPPFWKKEK